MSERTYFRNRQMNLRRSSFRVSFAGTLLWVLLVLNYTTSPNKLNHAQESFHYIDEFEIPVTIHKDKSTPVAHIKPPVIDKIVLDDIPQNDTIVEVKPIKSKDDSKTNIIHVPVPKPPLPQNDQTENVPFIIVEHMPHTMSCLDMISPEERYRCTQNQILKFFSRHLSYPELARENDIEGTVVLQFVIAKTGEIEQVKVVRDIGGGCGKETMRVFQKFLNENHHWTPGKQRGRAVDVRMTLPIKFQLNQ